MGFGGLGIGFGLSVEVQDGYGDVCDGCCTLGCGSGALGSISVDVGWRRVVWGLDDGLVWVVLLIWAKAW